VIDLQRAQVTVDAAHEALVEACKNDFQLYARIPANEGDHDLMIGKALLIAGDLIKENRQLREQIRIAEIALEIRKAARGDDETEASGALRSED
jgi:hypothetical protein